MAENRRSRRRAVEIMLDVLRDEGATTIFGNPGSTEMPFMDALVDASDFRYILGLQEATAVAMADGYALKTARPAFVNLHAAGGLGNAMGVLVASKASETPLVVTAGQQDTRHLFTPSISRHWRNRWACRPVGLKDRRRLRMRRRSRCSARARH
jgi:thiamine pyrophosphate-dependent acetolactate synthase large subunit-like protein